jgi:hypothetical protein
MLQRVKQCLVLAALPVVWACDLSDLTDGRAGGGGSGASGGTGGSGPGPGGASTGGSGGSGAAGAAGGEGGAACEVESPFTWLVELGNAGVQAISSADLLGATASSIQVASIPEPLGGGFLLAIVTEGPSLFDDTGDGRALYLARYSAGGALEGVRAHPQPPTGGEQPFVIADLLVDDAGLVYATGLVGRADVTLQTETATPLILTNTAPDGNLATDEGAAGLVMTFDAQGYALAGARLESKTTNGDLTAPKLFRFGGEVGITGVSRNGFTGLECTAVNATGNAKFGYVLVLEDPTLTQCARAFRFESTTAAALEISAATTDGASVYVGGRLSVSSGDQINFHATPMPPWLVTSGGNQGMLLAFDGATLAPRWVTLVEGGGVDDRVLGVGFDPATTTLWAAGSGNRGGATSATSTVTRRFSATADPPTTCVIDHLGAGSRANVITLDANGSCLAAARLSAGSEARAVVDGTPRVAGFAVHDPTSSLTTYVVGEPAPSVANGLLLSPTQSRGTITPTGALVGGKIAVRIEDLALVDGEVVVVGTMGERFLDLTCETSPPPGGFDFFVGAIDPAAIP